MRTIIPHTLRSLYICDETTDVEPSVNDFLSVGSILHVPNVNPYDGHVRFGGYLNDAWFRGKDNVVEQVVVLQKIFDVV